jgi:DNA helicase II / ATP-dependent DNA helicase PcrA
VTVEASSNNVPDVVRGLLRGLDADQRDAVLTDAMPLAIVAAAGSGKTTVLTRRIARRLADGTADASHVLSLTFTRDAAGELHRRLRRLDVRERIEAGTFHAVALRLLVDRAIAQHAPPPVVAPDRLRIVREVITELRMRAEPYAVAADIDWARARLVRPESFGRAARDAGRRPHVPPERFAEVTERYEALKRRRGVVDFDDLLERTITTIRDDPTFAEIVRWRFRHVFVDEAQDLNPLQFELLRQITAARPDICLVGDHRQAIYGWNGADPGSLTEVEQRFPGVTVLNLVGNHRCTPEIVRAGAAALSVMGIDDDTLSRRPDGRAPRIDRLADDRAEVQHVAALVRDLAQRHGARGVAVLARTNEQLGPFAAAIEQRGLAVVRSAGRSTLDTVLGEVHRCTTREQLAAWVESVWSGDGDTDRGTAGGREGSAPEGRGEEVEPVRRRVAEEVDRYLTADEPGGFRAWVEARHPFDDLLPDLGNDAVSVLTFHAAKGREWPAVVVTGVESGLVPHSSATTIEQRREESRLFYVALTRASDELTITASHQRNGRTTTPSPWLDTVAASVLVPAAAPPPSDMIRARRPADPLAALRAWRDEVARKAGIAPDAVCTVRALRTLAEHPPTDTDGIATVLGVSSSAAARLAPELLAVLAVVADQTAARSTSTGA